MRKIYGLIFSGLFLGGCRSAEMEALGVHMLKSFFFISLLGALIVVIIFLMNRLITANGETNNRACSIVGVLFFPVLIFVALRLKFESNWIMIFSALIFGGIIGWFSYAIDELLISFWERRVASIPISLGIALGGWLTILLFTHVMI